MILEPSEIRQRDDDAILLKINNDKLCHTLSEQIQYLKLGILHGMCLYARVIAYALEVKIVFISVIIIPFKQQMRGINAMSECQSDPD